MKTILHNVSDRRTLPAVIGSWEVEPLVLEQLTDLDKGRTVIYKDFSGGEAGTLSSFGSKTVWARFSSGDTAAGCDPETLWFAVKQLEIGS